MVNKIPVVRPSTPLWIHPPCLDRSVNHKTAPKPVLNMLEQQLISFVTWLTQQTSAPSRLSPVSVSWFSRLCRYAVFHKMEGNVYEADTMPSKGREIQQRKEINRLLCAIIDLTNPPDVELSLFMLESIAQFSEWVWIEFVTWNLDLFFWQNTAKSPLVYEVPTRNWACYPVCSLQGKLFIIGRVYKWIGACFNGFWGELRFNHWLCCTMITFVLLLGSD